MSMRPPPNVKVYFASEEPSVSATTAAISSDPDLVSNDSYASSVQHDPVQHPGSPDGWQNVRKQKQRAPKNQFSGKSVEKLIQIWTETDDATQQALGNTNL